MRGFPHLSLILSGLLLTACGPVGQSESQAGGSQALSSGSSGSSALSSTGVVLLEIPEFLYPEDQLLSVEREVQVRNASGSLERVQEFLLADGLGNSRLDVLGFSPDLVQPFSQPSSQLLLDYALRMRFLVRYRDLHLGQPSALLYNFRWIERPGLVQVAGVACKRYTAVSKHDLGNVEFLADAQTGLLLGWTYFSNSGEVLIKLESTVLDFNPNLNGVTWSAPMVSEQVYSGPADQPLLGFEPLEPQYLPPGFYPHESWLRFSAGFLSGMSDMLVRIYSDGLHLVFVAQHDQNLSGSQLRVFNTVTEVFEIDLGGIRVAEGMVGKRKLYVASLLSRDEIRTIFGSLLP